MGLGGGFSGGGRSYSDDEALIFDEELKRIFDEGNYTLAGRIVKHPEQRKKAIAFVKKLRKIGEGAGKELYAELGKEK